MKFTKWWVKSSFENVKSSSKILTKYFFFLLIGATFLYSCESKESKINKAKDIVITFTNNLSFDNYDVIYKYYPSFKDVQQYWKLKDFKITSATLTDNTITVIGKSKNTEILFEIEKINGEYIIKKSKGLSSDFNSNIYKYCKKIGCISDNNYDAEISKICKEKRPQFNFLIEKIKKNIEENILLENHTVTQQYDWASGDITIKNNSRFTIPQFSYNLYILYTDSNENVIFTSKEIANFESIPYGQSNTVHVFEQNTNSFEKVGISLKIINSTFIEELIAEYAEGQNCLYSNNL